MKGFWSISVDLYRKSERILINIDRLIQEKSKDFDEYRQIYIGKVKRIFANISQFIWEKSKDFGQYW